MESLREQQAKNNITHYVDGLPIPVPVNDDDDNNNDNGRRRQSSLSHWIFRSHSRSCSRSASRHSQNRDLEPTSSTSTEGQSEEYRFSHPKSTEISGPLCCHTADTNVPLGEASHRTRKEQCHAQCGRASDPSTCRAAPIQRHSDPGPQQGAPLPLRRLGSRIADCDKINTLTLFFLKNQKFVLGYITQDENN